MTSVTRTYDLLFMQSGNPVERPVEVTFSLNPTALCTGPQKAAQRWLMAFLTSRGSLVDDVNYGTDFMPALIKGQIQDEEAANVQFKAAAGLLQSYFDDVLDLDNTPDDERVVSAELLSSTKTDDRLVLNIKLTLASGADYTYIVPASTLVS